MNWIKSNKLKLMIISTLLTIVGFFGKMEIQAVATAQADIAHLRATKVDRAEFQSEVNQKFDQFVELLREHERNSDRRLRRISGAYD